MARFVGLLSVFATTLCSFVLLTVLTDTAHAQLRGTTRSIAPFGTYTEDVLGQINAANLNIHTVTPVRSKGKFFAVLENENNVWWNDGQGSQWAYNGAPLELFTSASSNVTSLSYSEPGMTCQWRTLASSRRARRASTVNRNNSVVIPVGISAP